MTPTGSRNPWIAGSTPFPAVVSHLKFSLFIRWPLPLPSWEREGPAKREGEGETLRWFIRVESTNNIRRSRASPSPSHRFAAGPALSHKGRGKTA
jgi:hypothetical protein